MFCTTMVVKKRKAHPMASGYRSQQMLAPEASQARCRSYPSKSSCYHSHPHSLQPNAFSYDTHGKTVVAIFFTAVTTQQVTTEAE